jgi:hypothetical protein
MFEKFINRMVCRCLHIEEKLFFNKPYKIKGFDSLNEADEWLSKYDKPLNLIQYCKVSEITEKEAQIYVACSEIGYIYSLKSPYYNKATRALRDAIKYEYCIIFI